MTMLACMLIVITQLIFDTDAVMDRFGIQYPDMSCLYGAQVWRRLNARRAALWRPPINESICEEDYDDFDDFKNHEIRLLVNQSSALIIESNSESTEAQETIHARGLSMNDVCKYAAVGLAAGLCVGIPALVAIKMKKKMSKRDKDELSIVTEHSFDVEHSYRS